MTTSPDTIVNVYAILTPLVLLLTVAEFIYCLYRKNGYYSFADSVIGFGTAILAQCVNVAVAVAVVASYGWIYENYALFAWEQTGLPVAFQYGLCYLGVDFFFYWFHRVGHRVNFFWALHVPHHSAEELNYAVALRAGFFQRAGSFLFYWPLAVFGFAPSVILPMVALNLVLQFIPHTRVIPKLPTWIDSWLNTPWHHQVHHAANPIYWDRNYGGTFIFWDKWFGSYRAQTETPYYGVTIHPLSWDPTYLSLHWFHVLWQDARQATHFIDALKIWFMPPGWRPRNLPPYDKKPALSAETQVKFSTPAAPGAKPYLVVQLALTLALMLAVIRTDSPLVLADRVLVAFALWVSITIWAGFLSSAKWALPLEAVRVVGLVILLNRLAAPLTGVWQAGLTGIGMATALAFVGLLGSRALRFKPARTTST